MAQESIPLVRTDSGENTDQAGLVKAVEGLRISLCAAGIGLGYAKYYKSSRFWWCSVSRA